MGTRHGWAAGIVVALAACASSGGDATDVAGPESASTATDAVAASALGCLDEAGSASGTIDEWYPEIRPQNLDYLESMPSATTSDRGVAFGQAFVDAVREQLPGFDDTWVRDETDFEGNCVTVRGAGAKRADGAHVNVTAWRESNTGQQLGLLMPSAFGRRDDTTKVAGDANLTTALVVADDGGAVVVTAYGSWVSQRMGGWPTTTPAPPDMPPPGPTPATADQVVAIAQAVMNAALDR